MAVFKGLDKKPPSFKTLDLDWSEYQLAIRDVIKNEDDNVIVEAVAGSGKTTTSRMVIDVLPTSLRIINVCFNKSVADEAGKMFPPHIECKTMHSLGMQAMRNSGQRRVSERKTDNILKYKIFGFDKDKGFSQMSQFDRDFYFEYRSVLCKLVGFAKGAGIRETEDFQNCYHQMADYHELDLPPSEDGELCSQFESVLLLMFEHSWNQSTTINFDDMIWMAALDSSVYFQQYDIVIVDEAQDLNACQRIFLKKLLGKTGRLIAIGDSRQSIYGFRGADNNSMQKIRDMFDCIELPLSICYRCDEKIVTQAKSFVPQIEAKPNAKQGICESIDEETFLDLVEPGDMVLCRTNAPLVGMCLDLLKEGYKAMILGKDISAQLLDLAKKIEKERGVLNTREIDTYMETKVEELKRREKFYEIRSLRDTCETLMAFGNRYNDRSGLKKLVWSIFKGKGRGSAIQLSTIHRVKGTEADRVFILRPDLLPLPFVTSPHQLEQEKNLEYVAITRAKQELYYVRKDD